MKANRLAYGTLAAYIAMAGLWLLVISALGQQPGAPTETEDPAAADGRHAATELEAAGSSDVTPASVLYKLHQTNLAQMGFGSLAMSKGSTPQLREYGNRLVRDHMLAEEKVTDLAEEMQVDLSSPPVPPTAEEQNQQEQTQALLKQLEGLEGEAFDERFLQEMEEAHERAIAFLRGAEARMRESPVQSLVGKLLPILEQHQQLAENLSLTIS